MASPTTATHLNPERTSRFDQLRRSLHSLATAGSEQQPLFPDSVVTADTLALDFEHWAAVIRDAYEPELTTAQLDALAAVTGKLATMSRDEADFDAELWTPMALTTSEHWTDVRSLAASALVAFGWDAERRADAWK